MLKKLPFVALVLGLSLGVATAYASSGSVTRLGTDTSGYANPGGCEIGPEGMGQLHVKCTHSEKAARIRYRFLADVGAVRGPASVSVDIHQIKGRDCTYSWMVPEAKTPARTVRVVVPAHSYCHIRSVTWSQP